jgi:hypothetical protein
MSKSTVFSRVADVAHKGVVIGLMSWFGFQMYQIGSKVYAREIDSPYMHSTYFQDVEKKVAEEYRKDNVVDHRDWYQADDDSYLKDQVRPNITKPEFKKQWQQK